MGLFDWISSQFIDVIEWTDDSHDTMVYRFPRDNHEIKYGAKLTVRESQMAVFVNEGVIADILGPGLYELETNNLPIMTSLEHWDHKFNSPFKAEVYFLNTKRFTDLKWGTKNPIMVRDPEFAMVRLRAFGTYEIRITNPEFFMKEIVGTDGHFTIDEIENQLTNLIVSKFTHALGESRVPVLDLASNYGKFGDYVTENIANYFTEYGLELTKLLVENISLPENVEQALDKRSSRAITGNLDEHIKYQTGEAIGVSGEGGSSAIADMIGMGAGIALGQDMANKITNKQVPPALPSRDQTMYHIALDDASEGPYDMRTIQNLINNKTIQRDTLMWREGLDEWQPAQEVIGKLFKSTPPPLPNS
ncbi:MAG TPA: SPFH domain-containing protein [Campylobacterales bacterium]|nr:SPFH domain-containing protein [Campylobacterales bacterium]HIP41841.1 SPFH domain-containing protein [Campylobacterales bacterium]